VTAPQDPYAPPPGPGGGAPLGTPGSGWSGSYGGGDERGAYGSSPAPQARNGLGIAALVLGILGFLTSFIAVGAILGLVAIGLGIAGLRRANRREATNRGMAITGIVLGALAILIGITVAIGLVTFLNNGGQELTECLADADNDANAVEECRVEFEDQVGALGRVTLRV
jgi:hypothetical protein